MDAAVGADGNGGAQRLLALGIAAGDSDHLGGNALLLQANRLFNGDLVKRVTCMIEILRLALVQ